MESEFKVCNNNIIRNSISKIGMYDMYVCMLHISVIYEEVYMHICTQRPNSMMSLYKCYTHQSI